MDFLQQLGIIALASRLKRLTERLLREGDRVYASRQISFEPRWFTIFSLLNLSKKSLSVTEIAETVGLTHPAVIQITGRMIEKGILTSQPDPEDGRRRMLTLSEKGRQLLPHIESIWSHFEEATRELFDEVGFDFLAKIERLERAFDRREMGDRILDLIKAEQYTNIEILDYSPEYQSYFQTLNEEWLDHYFSVEPYDKRVLSDPGSEILEKGGFVFFSRIEGEIVGTAALLKVDDQTFELAKMAVTHQARGKQAGLKLARAAIKKARECGATQILLMTDRTLTAACGLYQKLGFVQMSNPVKGAAGLERSRHGLPMKLDLVDMPSCY